MLIELILRSSSSASKRCCSADGAGPILVCSPSNDVCDLIAAKLVKNIGKNGMGAR